MNLSVTRLALDVRDFETQLTFSVKQGDTARRLEISLVDHTAPYEIDEGCYATFTARRSDNEFASESCVVAGNKIVCDLSPRLTSAAGIVLCEITLFSADGERLTSPHFTMAVYSSVGTEFADDATESDSFAVLTEAIASANAALEGAEAAVETAEGMFAALEESTSRANEAASAAENAAQKELSPATSERLGGVRTGENVTNNGGTISITAENVAGALGYTPPRSDTTYPLASNERDGLLSAELFGAIASALSAAKTEFGSYTGNGMLSTSSNTVKISLGIEPRVLLVFDSSNSGESKSASFGVMTAGQTNGAAISTRLYDVNSSSSSISVQSGSSAVFLPSVVFDGKTVSWGKMNRSDVPASAIFNAGGRTYSYVAIG